MASVSRCYRPVRPHCRRAHAVNRHAGQAGSLDVQTLSRECADQSAHRRAATADGGQRQRLNVESPSATGSAPTSAISSPHSKPPVLESVPHRLAPHPRCRAIAVTAERGRTAHLGLFRPVGASTATAPRATFWSRRPATRPVPDHRFPRALPAGRHAAQTPGHRAGDRRYLPAHRESSPACHHPALADVRPLRHVESPSQRHPGRVLPQSGPPAADPRHPMCCHPRGTTAAGQCACCRPPGHHRYALDSAPPEHSARGMKTESTGKDPRPALTAKRGSRRMHGRACRGVRHSRLY